jgi:hypothetical protein
LVVVLNKEGRTEAHKMESEEKRQSGKGERRWWWWWG